MKGAAAISVERGKKVPHFDWWDASELFIDIHPLFISLALAL